MYITEQKINEFTYKVFSLRKEMDFSIGFFTCIIIMLVFINSYLPIIYNLVLGIFGVLGLFISLIYRFKFLQKKANKLSKEYASMIEQKANEKMAQREIEIINIHKEECEVYRNECQTEYEKIVTIAYKELEERFNNYMFNRFSQQNDIDNFLDMLTVQVKFNLDTQYGKYYLMDITQEEIQQILLATISTTLKELLVDKTFPVSLYKTKNTQSI